MLIPLDDLVMKYAIGEGSVLHVGGHTGEEAEVYKKWDFHPVYWIEASDDTIGALRAHVAGYPENYVIQAAVADTVKEVTFHVANNNQSSSILEFGTHATEHPEVVFTESRTLTTTTIDILHDELAIKPANFMNLDIQGAELLALQGATNYLDHVKYIYTEVNEKELYKGCVLLPELDQWLAMFGFRREEISMTPHGWGDAFYVKRGAR